MIEQPKYCRHMVLFAALTAFPIGGAIADKPDWAGKARRRARRGRTGVLRWISRTDWKVGARDTATRCLPTRTSSRYSTSIAPAPSGRDLNTGRLRDQWHGMIRTGCMPRLAAHTSALTIEMNARDMERRGITDGGLVRLKGKRRTLLLRAAASNTLRPAQTFVPMHWGGRFMSGAGINALTLPGNDPVSRQPELKHAAVQVEIFTTGWQLAAMRRDDAGSLHAALQPWLARFDHASQVRGRIVCACLDVSENEIGDGAPLMRGVLARDRKIFSRRT